MGRLLSEEGRKPSDFDNAVMDLCMKHGIGMAVICYLKSDGGLVISFCGHGVENNAMAQVIADAVDRVTDECHAEAIKAARKALGEVN